MTEVARLAPARAWRPLARPETRVELVLAATVGLMACVGTYVELSYAAGSRPAAVLAYVLTGAATVSLALWRRRLPLATAAVSLGWCLAYHLLGYPGLAPALLLFAACYALAAHGPARSGLACALLVVLATAAIPTLPPHPLAWYDLAVCAPPTGMIAAAVVGHSARRSRLAHQEQVRQTAAATEARLGLQLAEERLRIARELHDVLAHTVAVVVVQSGVALDVLDEDRDEARQAMRAVRETAKQAMPELHAALELLRGDQPESPGPPRPQPGLDALDDLLGQFHDGGLRVELTLDPGLSGLAPLVQLTAYRIVQESLTNVLRHSTADRAAVRVYREGAEMRVEITDDGTGGRAPTPTDPGSRLAGGFGLAGMRERVEALGGGVVSQPLPEGGFRVVARIPVGRA